MSLFSSAAVPAVGPSPIEGVLLVDRIERPRPGFRFQASSLPGHLLHLVVAGRIRQECNGRRYEVGPRSAIWYHEDETVVGEVLAPWTFYTVNFIAPSLPPPELAQRVLTPRWPQAYHAFQSLLEAWRSPAGDAEQRLFAVHAALHGLITCLHPRQHAIRMDERSRLWWSVETRVRERLEQPPRLDELAALSGVSRAAIDRSCRHATGLSPQRRLKQVRLSLAKGLLAHGGLTIGAIAMRVGYGRIHEFSRDYRRAYGHPPSHDPGRGTATPAARSRQ